MTPQGSAAEAHQQELFSEEEHHAGALRAYHPNEISQRHKLVWMLHATGKRNKEIAELLNYTEARVSVIVNDPRREQFLPEFSSAVAEQIQDVRQKLRLHAPEAVDEVVDEMRHSTDANVRQRAAFGILDRAGYGKIDKRVVAHTEVTEEAARELTAGIRDLEELDAIEADYTIEED